MVHTKKIKIAFIKDWLTSYGGSEEQLLQLHKLYPEAPIYTSVYDKERLPQFAKADIKTMKVPAFLAKGRNFEKLALLLPHYFKSLQLDEYDVVVSITSGFAKGIQTSAKTKHLCICNTPIRFAWDFGGDQRGLISKIVSPYFRWYDKASSRDVDVFYANSKNVAKRIKQVYGRKSEVLYPPVKVNEFSKIKRIEKSEGFVTIGRLVPYKRVDIAVEACTKLDLPLTVIGEGPELDYLKTLAGPSIKFRGFVDQAAVYQELAKAKAFIFCADEDFGIAPVEAMAAGCPVVAYKKGGALETVVEGKSGMFFEKQNSPSLIKTLREFKSFDTSTVKRQVDKFSVSHYREQITKAIESSLKSDFSRLD